MQKFKFNLGWRVEASGAGFLLAQQRGYYRDAGLDITIDTGNGSAAAISLVAGGAYDAASADLSAMIEFNLANPQAALRAVAVQYDLNPNSVMVRRDGAIKKPADLTGKTLLGQPFNASRKLFPVFAKAQGFDATGVKWENVAPEIGDTRFAKGDFDGAAYFYFTGLLNLKARGMASEQLTVFRFSELGMKSYGNGLVANPKSMQESPEAMRAFVRATTRGWLDAIADPRAGAVAVKTREPLANEDLEFERLKLIVDGTMKTADTRSNGWERPPQRACKTRWMRPSARSASKVRWALPTSGQTAFCQAQRIVDCEPKRSAMSAIPVIDLSGALQSGHASAQKVVEAAHALRQAGRASGFFYVTDHGVPEALIEQQFVMTQRFFELPQANKDAISLAHSPAMQGYEGLGEQTLDAQARADLKESFYCGVEYPWDHPYVRKGYRSYGANQWPRQLPEMAAQCEVYVAAMRALAQRLMQLLAVSLGLEESYFDLTHDNPMITLRLLSYPPHPPQADELTFGAGAHTDWGAVTLLAQDSHGGLEVCMPDRSWVPATPMPGSLVVNLGDMIPRWTNDLYHSNPHRLRNVHSGNAKRHSIPFFYSPDYETSVAPIASCVMPGDAPRYAPCSAGEHLREMYVKTYGIKPSTSQGRGA